MVAVIHPEADSTTGASRLKKVKTTVLRQVVPSSSYSVARLKAFREYRTSTKAWWMVALMILTPIPSYIYFVVLNMWPLVNPKEGLRANYGFFLRDVVFGLVTIITNVWQYEYMCGWQISFRNQMLVTMVLAPILPFGLWIWAIIIGVFPVPFSVFLDIFSLMLFVTGLLIKMLQRANQAPTRPDVQTTAPLPVNQTQALRSHKMFIVLQNALLIVYSGFHAIFRQYRDSEQLAITLLLPCIKLIFSRVAIKIAANSMEDVAAEEAVFMVELFHSMYVSICMGGATTVYTTAALLAWDFARMAFSFWRLNNTAGLLVQRHRDSSGADATKEDMVGYWTRFAVINSDKLRRESKIRLETSDGMTFKPIRILDQWVRVCSGSCSEVSGD